MIKKILITGGILGILLAIAIIIPLAILLNNDRRTRRIVSNLPDAQIPVTAKLPLSVAQASARLEKQFGTPNQGTKIWQDKKLPQYGPQFADFTATSNSDGRVDFQFRSIPGGMSSDAPISMTGVDLAAQDPGLPAYLQLPVPARGHDYLLDTRSQWKVPGVQKDGRALPYNSWYFLHLESLSPQQTQITILGYNASVVDGTRWTVLGDMWFTAPRRVDNELSVPPAPADKRAMLNNVLKLLK